MGLFNILSFFIKNSVCLNKINMLQKNLTVH
jgi:hypothetical protein